MKLLILPLCHCWDKTNSKRKLNRLYSLENRSKNENIDPVGVYRHINESSIGNSCTKIESLAHNLSKRNFIIRVSLHSPVSSNLGNKTKRIIENIIKSAKSNSY